MLEVSQSARFGSDGFQERPLQLVATAAFERWNKSGFRPGSARNPAPDHMRRTKITGTRFPA
jgi:hypothetical protein